MYDLIGTIPKLEFKMKLSQIFFFLRKTCKVLLNIRWKHTLPDPSKRPKKKKKKYTNPCIILNARCTFIYAVNPRKKNPGKKLQSLNIAS